MGSQKWPVYDTCFTFMSLQNYLSAVNQYAISQHCEFLITVFLADNN